MAVLDQYEARQQGHDPSAMLEAEVGEFLITRHIDNEGSLLHVNFNLFAVIPKDAEAAFQQQLDSHKNRIRNRVITILQEVDVEHLKDPDVRWLKSELVRGLSEVLETRSVRDVVFTTFSLNRG